MKKNDLKKIKKLDLSAFDCGLITSALLSYKPLNCDTYRHIEALCDMFFELEYELRGISDFPKKEKKKKKKKIK